MKYTSTGILKYCNRWLLLLGDNEISKYYRKLVYYNNKTVRLNPSMSDGHITVIAGKYEDMSNHELWGKYNNEKIEFEYSNEVQNDSVYYWVPVDCARIEEIRMELGLNPTIKWKWHLTIGNLK